MQCGHRHSGACVMFSDETTFSLQFDSRRILIWSTTGSRYHQDNITRTRSLWWSGFTRLGWDYTEKNLHVQIEYRTDLHVYSNRNHGRPYLSEHHSGTLITCMFA
ncbi:hypothetical protein NPIL_47391 [Nephila pilipes]|uniref:Uncharacterized protein n=1 Tax=Nephila pilipes TaxID=299642 RepID=A0A8X6QR36_NEPPI|nr:hypothetical protein NPIL_47391 [Nephila pilipes]